MHIVFVTFGNITQHATLKRATGMARPLMRRGHQVTILIEDAQDNLDRVKLESPEVSVKLLQREGALHDLRQRQAYVDDLKPDVVWVCGPGLRNWIWRVSGRRDVITIADHSELLSGIPDRSKFRRVYDYVTELLFALTFKQHIVSSRYLERVYRKHLTLLGRKVSPLYFPYAYNREVLEADETPLLDELRRKHKGRKLIVYVGTFSENYGIFDMIEAAGRMHAQRNDFRYIFMGQGREKERALQIVEERGLSDVVEFPGYVEEAHLSSYFAAADVFVCPLRDTVQDWARCPSKLFLFLPYRKPVVTCKIGEAYELFGEDGFYYRPQSIEDMTKSLMRALDVASSSEKFPSPEDHDWDARVQKFLDWYNAQNFSA